MSILHTARLTLGRHTPADFEDCAAMWANPEVTRYIGGIPSTRSDSWDRLVRFAGNWALFGYGYWAVRETETGRFVGDIGFADRRRDIVPNLDDIPEIGWVLAPWAHGRGFATEAVLAAVQWGDAHLPDPRTVCLIDAANAASRHVAAKAGYREVCLGQMRGNPTLVLERERRC
jgi:RimJ/RimL family protein N-acetyltransferase